MKKQRFYYTFSGYHWAPESFRVRKGLLGYPSKELPLTSEERHQVGVLFLTEGREAAAGYVRHIERARERQRRCVMTYGFFAKEESGRFVYCPQLTCRSDAALKERLRLFKKVRAVLMETGGRVTVSGQCELDEKYRPVNVRENTVTADFSRPLRIPMGGQFIRDCPERLYRPRPRHPKNARKNTAPTR